MTEQDYLEQVLAVVHAKTLDGTLRWDGRSTKFSAQLPADTDATITVQVTGPDTALWSNFAVTTPGIGFIASVRNGHKDAKGSSYLEVAKGKTLERIDEIFEKVYLGPKRRQVAEALAAIKNL